MTDSYCVRVPGPNGHDLTAVMLNGEAWFKTSDLKTAFGRVVIKDLANCIDKAGQAQVRLPGTSHSTDVISLGSVRAELRRSEGAQHFGPLRRWIKHNVVPALNAVPSHHESDTAPHRRDRNSGGVSGDVTLFRFDGRDVRTVVIDGRLLWVLRDVCDILGYADAGQVTRWLEADDYTTVKFGDVFPGRAATALDAGRRITLVAESGLYELIFRSARPEARAFKHWVTHEVLPAIRRTGGYNVDPEPQAPSDSPIAGRLEAQLTKFAETNTALEASISQLRETLIPPYLLHLELVNNNRGYPTSEVARRWGIRVHELTAAVCEGLHILQRLPGNRFAPAAGYDDPRYFVVNDKGTLVWTVEAINWLRQPVLEWLDENNHARPALRHGAAAPGLAAVRDPHRGAGVAGRHRQARAFPPDAVTQDSLFPPAGW